MLWGLFRLLLCDFFGHSFAKFTDNSYGKTGILNHDFHKKRRRNIKRESSNQFAKEILKGFLKEKKFPKVILGNFLWNCKKNFQQEVSKIIAKGVLLKITKCITKKIM